MEHLTTVNEVLDKFGREVVSALGRSLPREKDASGELRDSIKFKVRRVGGDIIFELILADYYLDVDEGSKKGTRVDVESLLDWVKVKPLHLQFKTLPFKDIAKLTDLQRAKSKQFTINKFGIKETNFYSKVVTRARLDKLQTDLAKAAKNDILIQIRTNGDNN